MSEQVSSTYGGVSVAAGGSVLTVQGLMGLISRPVENSSWSNMQGIWLYNPDTLHS